MTETIAENLTREETCRFLRVGSTSLWQLEVEGLLKPSFRIGRKPLYRRADLERFIARQSKQPRPKRKKNATA